MEMGYEDWGKKVEQEMGPYIDLFCEELNKGTLSLQTKRRHVGNIELFLIDYTVRYHEVADRSQPLELFDVCLDYADFVGYFFIRKCMWATPASTKQLCASLKKFFKCMTDLGKLTEEEYASLTNSWKEDVEGFVALAEDYDDLGSGFFF